MPPQRLVFEGSTPEAVLLEAYSEHGADVQLTEPERFRRGGVMGFFAESGFRVRVLPDSTGGRAVAVVDQAGAPASVETYLDASPDVSVELDGPRPANFDEALERAVDALGPSSNSAMPDAFDTLVANLQREQAGPELGASLTGSMPAPSTPGPYASDHDADPLAPYRYAAMNGELVGVSASGETAIEEPVAPLADATSESVGTWPPSPSDRKRYESDTARVASSLRTAGFPNRLLAAAAGRLPAGFDMEDVFASMPAARPIPSVAGTLIAIVGSESRALAQARSIAAELRLSPAETALARATIREDGTHDELEPAEEGRSEETLAQLSALPPDLYVETPDQATALSPGWRRDRIGIVAVALDPTLAGAVRARAMLRALRPSITLLVADATHKAADIAFRADALGGVDALLLHNLGATMTPAEMLSADIPVARLENDASTPAAWVDLVEATVDERAGGDRR